MLRLKRQSKYYRALLLFVLLFLLVGVVYAYAEKLGIQTDITSPVVPVRYVDATPSTKPNRTNVPSPSKTPLATPLPAKKASVILDVPFLVQAPFAKWDQLHEEACEEASLLNVKYYLDKKNVIDKTEGENEIQKLVAYQSNRGYGVSITLEQLNAIAKDVYGMKAGRVETNVTVEGIKAEIRAGRPVIVGAAGKILPNPFFKNGGPNYHMLVIKGYDDNGVVPVNKCKRIDGQSCSQTPGVFITNDVGISQGKDFRYTYDALYKAIHDWDPNNILHGQKTYLVFD